MKKTATLLALAGLSMAAPEHVHGSFRNRKVPEHKQLVDPYVAHKSETLNADDDELLLIYRPQYDIDPGMVIRPPRGYDIDPGMVIRPPYGDIDRGIFVKPRTTPQVMYADDELIAYLPKDQDKGSLRQHKDDEFMVYVPKEKDHGTIRQHRDDELYRGVDPKMIIKPKRGDIDPGMIIKPKRGDIDPKLILKPNKDFIYVDDELFKGVDPKMIIKPKRGDIDPGMIIKPKRGDIDPKIILNPKKDVIYADDELMVYLPRELRDTPARFHLDDELFVNKGIDAGMVIKPKRGDIDPKIIIKPKRGDIDPKIILNPKKDVIYADDELVVLADLLNHN